MRTVRRDLAPARNEISLKLNVIDLNLFLIGNDRTTLKHKQV